MSSIKIIQKHLPVQKTINIFDKSSQEYLKALKLCNGVFDEDSSREEFEEKVSGSPIAFTTNTLESNETDITGNERERKVLEGYICSSCKVSFESLDKQKEHFKLDWHRFNLKQKSTGGKIIPEDEFESQISGELSSISGSDSDSSEDIDDDFYGHLHQGITTDQFNETSNKGNIFTKHPFKQFYISKNGTLISFYKNVILKKNEVKTEDISPGNIWIYIMLSGGHFAGAVYNRNELVAHKTFHRYTIRAKRGTVQSVQDKKQGGHAPKSAGASIRRHNEAALIQDIECLLISWSEYIKQADRIFFRCSTYNLSSLFNEKVNIKRDDRRLVKLSLATWRPTLKEVKRIHALFSVIETYGELRNIIQNLKDANILSSYQQNENVEDNDSNIKVIERHDVILNDDVSTELNATPSPQNTPKNERKKKNKKTKLKEKKDTREIDETNNETEICTCSPINQHILPYWKQLKEWCIGDNLDMLQNSFVSDINIEENTKDILILRKLFHEHHHINYCCSHHEDTLLHSATMKNNKRIISLLMLNGADPAIKNYKSKLPYDTAETKDTRNEFRRFMAKYPDKYDYKKANIPSALTEEEESEQQLKAAEKKKAQNKARKERAKVKKAEERKQKIEERERKSFEALSDREKRAVMAERRFASQLTNSMRCSNCRTGINEKDAFQRYEYKYCSVKCTNDHKIVIGK